MTRVVRSGVICGLLLLTPAASLVEAAGPASPAAEAQQQNAPPTPAPNGTSSARTDIVITFRGLTVIRRPIVESAASLDPEQPITRAQVERAARRVDAIPGVSDVRVVYLPAPANTGSVDFDIKERSWIPQGFAGWGAVGGRAIFSDELRVDIANLTHHAEVWTIGYRWTAPRERITGRLELPVRGLPGTLAIEGLAERQTYRPPIAGLVFAGTSLDDTGLVQRRRRIGAEISDWATGWWRWLGGAAFDSIGGREYLGLDAGVDFRAARDHVSLMLLTSYWRPFNDGDPFASALTALAWRSTTEQAKIWFYGDVGVSAVTSHAPLAVWPGSHTSAERGGNLRAHPLRDSDVIAGDVFGRRVIFGSINAEQLLTVTKFGRVSVAEFIDTGRAWQRMPGLPSSSPFHVDIGLGLRLAGSKAGGTVRLDYARGLRDGRNHVSAGWVREWPGR